jgi:hypothetical protein
VPLGNAVGDTPSKEIPMPEKQRHSLWCTLPIDWHASNYYMAVITAYSNLLGENCPHIDRIKKKMDFSA